MSTATDASSISCGKSPAYEGTSAHYSSWEARRREVLAASDRVPEITHDHSKGMKGARAVTEAIWLALHSRAGARRTP